MLIGDAVGAGVGMGVAVGVGVYVAIMLGVGVAFCEPVQPQTSIVIISKTSAPAYLILYLRIFTIIEGIYSAWDICDRSIRVYQYV